MAIKALSYIGVNSDKFEDWSYYSQKNLGMQLVDRGKGILSFRMDDQKQRLTITGDKGDNLGFLGWEVEKPKATMFVWAKIPKKFNMKSMEFSELLLKEAKIAVSPGLGFGVYGDDFVRFSLIENEHRTKQALKNLKKIF